MKCKKCLVCEFKNNCKDQCKKVLTRNELWKTNKYIPHWVDLSKVKPDQFFTNKDTAEYCFNKLKEKINIKNYIFIEPAAGSGIFYDLLPRPKIGIDLYPLREEFIRKDFLEYEPDITKKYIAIGNPPFGTRGWLALSFMWKLETFVDYIGMILPMSFQSDGKGTPKTRIKNMNLIYNEILPKNSFHTPDKKLFRINSVFQIWERGENKSLKKYNTSNLFDIYSVCTSYSRICGMKKMKDYNCFISSSWFGELKGVVKTFAEVKYESGFGLIIKDEKVLDILKNIEWNKYANLSANGCWHLNMKHIQKAVLENET